MVGQGSVNHNSRAFNAKNTDPERSHLNITYCHENIKTVFHELFDEALKRYNDKQTRADRKIEDYYEKIRSSKQEKPFHEIILQVGNKDDMSAEGEDGQLAAAVLDEYMRGCPCTNPVKRIRSSPFAISCSSAANASVSELPPAITSFLSVLTSLNAWIR